MRSILVTLLAASLAAAPAAAAEIFAGAYLHDIDSPLNASGIEPGVDVMIGWRGKPIVARLQPYALAAVNSAGETHYAAAGLAWTFGRRVYVRPGLGLAIHSGSAGDFQRRDRIAFGSRLLIEPELGVGFRLTERASVEASWVHMSHAALLSRQNPGIDNVGFRLNWKL